MLSKWDRNWLILVVLATLWAWQNNASSHVHGAGPAVAQQPAGPVLFDFTADWCEPCQQMKPILRQLQAAGYTIRVVDCTDRQRFENAKAMYGFRSLPTFIAFDGQREVARQTGLCSASDLVGILTAGKPTAPRPADYNALLTAEGRRIGVQSLRSGKNHPALQAMAQRHANYQASVGVQGHQGWDGRVQELYRDVTDCGTFSEVAAESWPAQDASAAAVEMYRSWRQSSGHWREVSSGHTYWGYAMAYSPGNRTWYAAGVFGDARQGQPYIARQPITQSNFVVSAADPVFAERVQAAAEQYRRELAIEWLGQELPNWASPCTIRVVAGENLGAGGATSFKFEDGEVFGWRMSAQGSPERILESVLPHEITHTLFASHFRQPAPRWADEGAATTVEHASERAKYDLHLVEFLRTGRGLAFDQMLAMSDYPRDVAPLYAQGHSVSEFLIQHNGKQGFVGFLEDLFAAGGDYRTALKANYDYDTTAELQTAWLEWVRAGSPRVQHEAFRLVGSNGAAPRCRCHRWRPLKRLWEHRPGFVFPKLVRQQRQPQGQPPSWQGAPPIVQNGSSAPPPVAAVEPQLPYQQQPAPDLPLVDVSPSPPAASRPPEASSSAASDPGGRNTEAPPWRPGAKIGGAIKKGIDQVIPVAETAVEKGAAGWLTGALVSFGIPGGAAAVAASAATWLLMRRGKKRLGDLNEQLQTKVRNYEQDARIGSLAPRPSGGPPPLPSNLGDVVRDAASAALKLGGKDQSTYGPTYNLSPAYADDLAAKRANQGMTLGQQSLLAQIQQEAIAKLRNGDFRGSDLAQEMEHWIMGQFLAKHGVRTTLERNSALPGQAVV